MSKVPRSAAPDVQEAIESIWQELANLTTRNVDMNGRRIINAGAAVAPMDYVTKQEIVRNYSFDGFYRRLKETGLDGFPGLLRDPQQSRIMRTISTQRPRQTGEPFLFFETDTGRMLAATGTGYVELGGTDIGFQNQENTWEHPQNIEVDGADACLHLTRDAGASASLCAGTSSITFGSTTNHPLIFRTNGAERMRIAADGKVGVGVTPANIFHVAGTEPSLFERSDGGAGTQPALLIKRDGAVSFSLENSNAAATWLFNCDGFGRFNITKQGTAGAEILCENETTDFRQGRSVFHGTLEALNNHASRDILKLIRFSDSKELKVTAGIDLQSAGEADFAGKITTAASLGVNAASPAARIDVGQNVGRQGIHIRSSNTGPELKFIDSADSDEFSWQFNRGQDRLELHINETATHGFTKAGRLGINTLAPSERLHVNGNAIITGNLTVNGTFDAFAGFSSVRARRTTDATIGTGGVVIVFNTEDRDTQNEYDPTNGRFTAGVAGTYHAVAAVQLQVTNGNEFGVDIIRRNSAGTLQNNHSVRAGRNSSGGTLPISVLVSAYFQMAAGDRLDVAAFTTASFSLLGVSSAANYFHVERVK